MASEEIRKMLRESGIDPDAKANLIIVAACAVSDDYCRWLWDGENRDLMCLEESQLKALEAATRDNPIRRIRLP